MVVANVYWTLVVVLVAARVIVSCLPLIAVINTVGATVGVVVVEAGAGHPAPVTGCPTARPEAAAASVSTRCCPRSCSPVTVWSGSGGAAAAELARMGEADPVMKLVCDPGDRTIVGRHGDRLTRSVEHWSPGWPPVFGHTAGIPQGGGARGGVQVLCSVPANGCNSPNG